VSCVWVVLAIFSGVFLVLVDGAWPAMQRYNLRFLVSTGWDPVHLQFGALPFIVGTLLVAFFAMAIAGAVGLLTAICITELLPGWLSEAGAYLVELLAFIPSVVYGLFGSSSSRRCFRGRFSRGLWSTSVRGSRCSTEHHTAWTL
jgi:phosphate transport system permease protein